MRRAIGRTERCKASWMKPNVNGGSGDISAYLLRRRLLSGRSCSCLIAWSLASRRVTSFLLSSFRYGAAPIP